MNKMDDGYWKSLLNEVDGVSSRGGVDKVSNKKFFPIRGKKDKFDYFAKYYYYPFSRYPDITDSRKDTRDMILRFKKGINTSTVVKDLRYPIYEQIEVRFKNPDYNNIALCVIPASTIEKHNTRFRNFCQKLSNEIGIINGFSFIGIRHNRSALKGCHHVDKTSNLTFNSSLIRNKDIILFDDIITFGDSFVQTACELTNIGARSVLGVFLGKTYWNKEDNDQYFI